MGFQASKKLLRQLFLKPNISDVYQVRNTQDVSGINVRIEIMVNRDIILVGSGR